MVGSMPLMMVGAGRRVKMRAIRGGREVQARLASLGLVPGAELEIVRCNAGGPLIVAVGGTRVILGRGMAMKVDVI